MQSSRAGKRQILILGTVVAISGSLSTFGSSKPVERFDACLQNLLNISSAFEMYSLDHEGHYPKSLKELVPEYLEEIPQCPSAGYDSYSPGLEVGIGSPHNRVGFQDFYYLCCSGNNHPDASTNAPGFPSAGMGCPSRDDEQMRRAYGYLGELQ